MVTVDPNTPASTRVRAADSVLDHSAKSIEIEDPSKSRLRFSRADRTIETRLTRAEKNPHALTRYAS
jgi:hypothetical protein